jgi:hypothetical protein
MARLFALVLAFAAISTQCVDTRALPEASSLLKKDVSVFAEADYVIVGK